MRTFTARRGCGRLGLLLRPDSQKACGTRGAMRRGFISMLRSLFRQRGYSSPAASGPPGGSMLSGPGRPPPGEAPPRIAYLPPPRIFSTKARSRFGSGLKLRLIASITEPRPMMTLPSGTVGIVVAVAITHARKDTMTNLHKVLVALVVPAGAGLLVGAGVLVLEALGAGYGHGSALRDEAASALFVARS